MSPRKADRRKERKLDCKDENYCKNIKFESNKTIKTFCTVNEN